jgi:hypothetical protein
LSVARIEKMVENRENRPGLAGLSKNGWLKFKILKIIVKNRAIKKIYGEKIS